MTNNGLDINNLPDLLTVTETAKIFRVTNMTIKRWCDLGKLGFVRINSRGDRRILKELVIKKLNNER